MRLPFKNIFVVALCLLVTLISFANTAHAGKIDSVYASVFYLGDAGVLNVSDSTLLFGKPDDRIAVFAKSSSTCDVAFQNFDHNDLLPIKKTSSIIIWGKKATDVDSSAGQVIFEKFDMGGSLVSSKPFYLADGINVIPVPGDDYVYVEISLALPSPPYVTYAKKYFVDAVALVQDTSHSVSVHPPTINLNSFANYPNPFNRNTTVRFENEVAGNAVVMITDALGRQITSVTAGFCESGVHEIPTSLLNAGIYFARVFIDGKASGTSIKLISE
ncbi:MAG: T9SS type A sorting domain-containing protein [bacterium]